MGQPRELERMGMLGAMLVAALGSACSSESNEKGMLPVSNEIGDWIRTEPVVVADTDTELYANMDGAAPKYIDGGWKASAYATYSQGASVLVAYVHDMGTPENAQAIFNRFLPVSRRLIQESPMAVVDMSASTSYASFGWKNQYYVEVSINDSSDAALVYVKTFMLQILAR